MTHTPAHTTQTRTSERGAGVLLAGGPLTMCEPLFFLFFLARPKMGEEGSVECGVVATTWCKPHAQSSLHPYMGMDLGSIGKFDPQTPKVHVLLYFMALSNKKWGRVDFRAL